MKNFLKLIGVFLFIVFCFIGLSFFMPQGNLEDTKIITQSGVPTLSGITDKVQSRVGQILDDKEVQRTIQSIEKDSPRYYKDGAIFMNRERLLPVQKERSYYHEWTVRTPGSSDRGARRIIEGKNNELYFTDDHYDSFTRVR